MWDAQSKDAARRLGRCGQDVRSKMPGERGHCRSPGKGQFHHSAGQQCHMPLRGWDNKPLDQGVSRFGMWGTLVW